MTFQMITLTCWRQASQGGVMQMVGEAPAVTPWSPHRKKPRPPGQLIDWRKWGEGFSVLQDHTTEGGPGQPSNPTPPASTFILRVLREPERKKVWCTGSRCPPCITDTSSPYHRFWSYSNPILSPSIYLPTLPKSIACTPLLYCLLHSDLLIT